MESLLPPNIGKQYQILQPLAQGKFGNVFLGKIKKTDETIIIKQGITPQTPSSQSSTLASNKTKNSGGTAAVETIRHEAEILTFLNQDLPCRKHIPFVHWYGLCDKGIYCIAMSYIPTTPLQPFSQEFHNIQEYESQLQQMLREIVQALKAIHQKGIIHRDLKPENILYHQTKRRWFLIDFGLATFYQDEDGNHKSPTAPPRKHLIGTPNYVSCFIHEGQDPSRRDDLIALGNVAWWLRNGGSWASSRIDTPQLTWEQTVEYKKALVNQPITLEKNPENLFRIKVATFIKKCYTLSFTDTPPYDMISTFFS
jgi:serine/threonine protein kinase